MKKDERENNAGREKQGKLINTFVTCYLLNDAVASSEYIASNDIMINERRTGKYMKGSGRALIKYSMPEFACRV